MKRHIVTIILLALATGSFMMRFFVKEGLQGYCDIAAFVFPTVAALMEIFITERSGKATDEKIQYLKEKQLSVHVEGETLVIEKEAE